LNTIRLALTVFQKYQMIKISDNDIKIVNWDKHQNIDGLDRIRENTRLRVANYRKHKRLEQSDEQAGGNVTVTLRNAIEKSRVDKDNTNVHSPIKGAFKGNVPTADFEVAWKAYPNKLGRKQAEKYFYTDIKRGKKLEDILKAIENYARYRKDNSVEDKYIKHGSTFFNNWEDFLTYEPAKPKILSRTQLVN
jgi:hypothetical protein